jgi:hypothetical protein
MATERTQVTADALRFKEKALKKEPIPPLRDEVYGQILFSLSEDRKACVVAHRFKQGAALNRAIEAVKQLQLEGRKAAAQAAAEDKVEKESRSLQADLDRFDAETGALRAKMEEKLALEGRRLRCRHAAEVAAHEAAWSSGSKAKDYNHASACLTGLRRQLAAMLLQNMLEEAAVAEAALRERQTAEECARAAAMQVRFTEAQRAMQQRHAQEVAQFEAGCEVRREDFVVMRVRGRGVLENRARIAEGQRAAAGDRERVWKRGRGRQEAQSAALVKLRRGDLSDGDCDAGLLALPPLRSLVEERRKGKGRRKK